MRIIVAEDSQGIRDSLGELLSGEHEVILCSDGTEALEIMEKREYDLVIPTIRCPN